MLSEKFNKINKNKSYLIVKEIGFTVDNLIYTTDNKLKVIKSQWMFPLSMKFKVHDILENNLDLDDFSMNIEFQYEMIDGNKLTLDKIKEIKQISTLEDFEYYIKQLKMNNVVFESNYDEENKSKIYIEEKYYHIIEKYENIA